MIPVVKRIIDVKDFDLIDLIEKDAFVAPFPKEVYLYDYMNHPYSEYYKLFLNNNIIGFFGLWVIDDTVQLTTIAVSPKLQKKGYGKLMMEFIINYLREKNCKNITLEVRVSNQKAINFYLKFRFIKVATRKRYYENGEDAYLMKLDL